MVRRGSGRRRSLYPWGPRSTAAGRGGRVCGCSLRARKAAPLAPAPAPVNTSGIKCCHVSHHRYHIPASACRELAAAAARRYWPLLKTSVLFLAPCCLPDGAAVLGVVGDDKKNHGVVGVAAAQAGRVSAMMFTASTAVDGAMHHTGARTAPATRAVSAALSLAPSCRCRTAKSRFLYFTLLIERGRRPRRAPYARCVCAWPCRRGRSGRARG